MGGVERFQYRFHPGTRFPGQTLLNEGSYQDIVPDERIVSASTMSLQDKRISSSLLTFQFVARGDRTLLVFTHQAAFFEGSDGPQMREAGWVTLLDGLKESLT